MIYKKFRSGVITRDVESKTYYGVVENAVDYVKFESTTFAGIEAQFHEAVDKYIEDCERIGKDPFIKSKDKSLGY